MQVLTYIFFAPTMSEVLPTTILYDFDCKQCWPSISSNYLPPIHKPLTKQICLDPIYICHLIQFCHFRHKPYSFLTHSTILTLIHLHTHSHLLTPLHSLIPSLMLSFTHFHSLPFILTHRHLLTLTNSHTFILTLT